jgi:predicted O-linked N-acetylglucosamine transferase (SPINDLY family)
MFQVWIELLKETSGSVLWLMKLNDVAQDNLTKEIERNGLDPNRLVFATRVPRVEDHLARFSLANLFLDTFPYNGHTTVSDALLSCVPVITMKGTSFPSNVASSLLFDIGLNSYVTQSLEEYKSLAILLANNSNLLNDYKDKIKEILIGRKWPHNIEDRVSSFSKILEM